MANPIQHAKTSAERVHEAVRPYMPETFYQLGINYGLLLISVVAVNMLGIPLILRFIPLTLSTANILGFSVMLLILVYGWRFLEKRNSATAIFVLYTRYSRERRNLQDILEQAENGVLEDENTIYTQVDILEETASNFLDAVEQQGVKAHEVR